MLFRVYFSKRTLTWLAVAVTFLSSGCHTKTPSKNLSIVVSGDTKGWITPCGCAANQAGGLARRSTLLKQLNVSDGLIYLDAGGSASGTSEYHRLKLTSILRGDVAMGMLFHNVGAPETLLSPEQLSEIASNSKAKWISTNLRTRSPWNGTKVEVIRKGDLRILITGVIDPKLIPSDSPWKASDPVNSILDAWKGIDADVRIVLAYMDEVGLKELAQSLPEIDFLVGGPTGQAMSPTQIGRVQVLSATNKGKYLARIRILSEGKEWRVDFVGPLEVASKLAEDSEQKKNLDAMLAELANRDFDVHEAGIAERLMIGDKNYRIAGSQSCEKCHGEDQIAWHATKHGHAWEPLVAKKSHVDPYCQQCHTTGYGYEGGFVSVAQSTSLVHVGCENCHGPSASHVANPRTKTPFQSKDQCVRCHDHENSPQFAYDLYWPKVNHGKKK